MENYKLLNKLADGLRGPVWQVEHRGDGSVAIIKMCECRDERDAEKAFKETSAFRSLKHPYICHLKECFLQWNAKDSSIFVCTTMQPYKRSLGDFLKERREKKAAIFEEQIQEWLAQLIDALAFAHKKKIIHRNLKLSNILLDENNKIALSGFGAATSMNDVKARVKGNPCWMAPELMESSFDERSDTWALGCLLLQLVTFNSMTCKQFEEIWPQMKKDDSTLEEVLAKVDGMYSADLKNIIRRMLRIHNFQRPKAIELISNSYIQICLRKIHSNFATEFIPNIDKVQEAVPIPKGNDAVRGYLIKYTGNEKAVKDSLEYIKSISERGVLLADVDIAAVLRAMRNHPSSDSIQAFALTVFATQLTNSSCSKTLFAEIIVYSVIETMKVHSKVAAVQQPATAILKALVVDGPTAMLIGQLGGIEEIVNAIKNLPDNPVICAQACNAIWSLAVNVENFTTLTNLAVMPYICKVLATHAARSDVVVAACTAVLSLYMDDLNMTSIIQNDCVTNILNALHKHQSNEAVVNEALLALIHLIEAKEECALQVLMHGQGRDKANSGVALILNLYEIHKDNAKVVEYVCMLIMKLASYSTISPHLHFGHVADALNEVRARFIGIEEIIDPCSTALEKIQAVH